MNISKLKSKAAKLPLVSVRKLKHLLMRESAEQREAAEFDRQISEDAKAGKLDQLADRARAHYQAGNTTSL